MDTTDAVARIASELRQAGVRAGEVLLAHSSLKSMGTVPGGAETVIRGLLEALGASGTLMLPALSYASVGATNPVFDVRTTPSCVGAITEHFRTRTGSIRSISPTHSVCGVGPRAEALLGRHHLDGTPCGPNSPFRVLRDVGGQILMLGCGLRPNTSMHGVEELVEPPYLFGDSVKYRIITADGSELALACRRHSFAGYEQRYDRIAQHLAPDELRVGHVLEATVHVIEARALWRRAEAVLREDPLHFVEPRGSLEPT